MNNIPSHIDELISKYLAGEASSDEVSQVDAWAAAQEENKKYLQQLELIFNKASTIRTWQNFDADAAWSKMRDRMKGKSTRSIETYRKPSFSFLRIAATIAFLLSVTYVLYQITNSASDGIPPVAVSSAKETKSDTLPDGTNVFLNKLTKIDYAFDKKRKTHKVTLKGEAYFHIKHEENKKFLVEADGVYIRDIGTAFNVKAYPDGNIIEVVVEEGEVQFFSDENPGIYLKAGGRGVYNKKEKTFTIESPEANVLAYKTKFFSFSNASLLEVVTALNAVYDKKIILSKALEECRLTVSFNNEDISEIASIIGETLNLTVTVKPDGFLLEGNACE